MAITQRFRNLRASFQETLAQVKQHAQRLRLPAFIRYDEHGVLPEYQEADAQARKMGVNVKEYGASSDWSPDDVGADDRPSATQMAPDIEFIEWTEPGLSWPGSPRDPALD